GACRHAARFIRNSARRRAAALHLMQSPRLNEGTTKDVVGTDVDMKTSGGKGLFWGEKAVGELKLFEVTNGLLTTTDCGFSPLRPLRMVLRVSTVNSFIARKV